MPHDIIDNQDQKLVDHINAILSNSESAKFAVGYFFLSGLGAIQDKLSVPVNYPTVCFSITKLSFCLHTLLEYSNIFFNSGAE